MPQIGTLVSSRSNRPQQRQVQEIQHLFIPYSTRPELQPSEENEDYEDSSPMTVNLSPRSPCQVHRNENSIILLFDKYAIKIHRYPSQLVREWSYYGSREDRHTLNQNEIKYYGGIKLDDLDFLGVFDVQGYGIVLERIDDKWLRSKRQTLLGKSSAEGRNLPHAERILARMLLRSSAALLHPDHGQINEGDIVVILEDRAVARAFIIDHGDQPDRLSDGCYNITELNSVLQTRGLHEDSKLPRVFWDRAIFAAEKIIAMSVRQPSVAFGNLMLMCKDCVHQVQDWYYYSSNAARRRAPSPRIVVSD